MSSLDLISCTICTLLIWFLWQQLQKVQLVDARRRRSLKKQNEKMKSKDDGEERIIIEERERNLKKKSLSPVAPKSSSPVSSPQYSRTASTVPTIPPVDAQEGGGGSSNAPVTSPVPPQSSPISKSPTASSDQTNEAMKKNRDKPDGTEEEYGPVSKQKILPQKPWVMKGEAYYPPNFYTASQQSK